MTCIKVKGFDGIVTGFPEYGGITYLEHDLIDQQDNK